jgi:HNH endonuclease/EVE domain
MARYFTHYWQNKTFEDYQARGTEGEPFGGLLSNEFVSKQMRAGDYLYGVTVLSGEMFVLGRMEVERVELYPQSPQWQEHAIGRASTPRHFDNRVPSTIVEQLEFISGSGVARLKFDGPGKLDRQTLRGVRELTPNSATLLDQVIDQYELAHPSELLIDEEVAGAPAWLFQYRQSDYEIEEFVENHDEYDWWEVTGHRSELQTGDRVYFRRTQGEQPSGITAIGRLVSPVYATGLQDHPYRVDVHYEQRVVPTLTTEEMAKDEVLGLKPALSRGVQGTNFSLSVEEAGRIRQLTRGHCFEFAPHELVFDPGIALDERTRTLATVVQRQGQPEFRSRLIAAYEGRCAVTGCDAVEALEAAHIRLYLGQHTNIVTNGLLLRADIHTLFDKGLLAINSDDLEVVLHPSLMTTVYREFAGKPLRLPYPTSCHPNRDSLRHHRQRSEL